MIYAINKNNEKIEATPKAKAFCPFCKSPVIACVGEIKNKYWRHEQKASKSCVAAQYENEKEWHSTWKRMFGPEFSEVYYTIGNESRKADVKLSNGLVIEIQHSSIDSREIRARELFHGKMVWIFDGTGPFAAGRLKFEKDYFFWEQPRMSILKCSCPVFVECDFGVLIELLEFETIKYREEDWHDYRKSAFKGKCNVLTREEFKNRIIYADVALKNTRPNFLKGFKRQFLTIENTTQLSIF